MEQATDALQKKIVARMLIDGKYTYVIVWVYLDTFVLAMIKEVVKKKFGIKPEPSIVSENATEGTEDTPESKRIIIEAGKHTRDYRIT